MHNSCLGISPKYLIFRNAPKPIIDLCGISFLCANFETFTIFSAIALKLALISRTTTVISQRLTLPQQTIPGESKKVYMFNEP